MPDQDSPRPGPVGEERRVVAWIGQGVVVEGRITSTQDLRIDGKVEGTIEVGNHGVILGAEAKVKANLVARSIVVSGAVIGNITATERLDLHATATVQGDIQSPRLVVADGATINGKIDTGVRRSR
jgi:cytoskeletal protein CcmA (bactofilin family)